MLNWISFIDYGFFFNSQYKWSKKIGWDRIRRYLLIIMSPSLFIIIAGRRSVIIWIPCCGARLDSRSRWQGVRRGGRRGVLRSRRTDEHAARRGTILIWRRAFLTAVADDFCQYQPNGFANRTREHSVLPPTPPVYALVPGRHLPLEVFKQVRAVEPAKVSPSQLSEVRGVQTRILSQRSVGIIIVARARNYVGIQRRAIVI